jgi:hypothetical protein
MTIKSLGITEQDEYKKMLAYIEEHDARPPHVNTLDQRALSTFALEAAFHRKLKHLLGEMELTPDPLIKLEVYESAKTYFARQSKILMPNDKGDRVLPDFKRFCAGAMIRPGNTQWSPEGNENR